MQTYMKKNKVTFDRKVWMTIIIYVSPLHFIKYFIE